MKICFLFPFFLYSTNFMKILMENGGEFVYLLGTIQLKRIIVLS